MFDKSFHKCECGCIATYWYMPASDIYKDSRYFCEDCISSKDDKGCSCNYHWWGLNPSEEDAWEVEIPEGIENVNWRWVDGSDRTWINLDEKGRPYACCEYDFDHNGYELERKLELTESQISEIITLPSTEKNYAYIDIHLKDGRILVDFFNYENSYIQVNENDPVINSDISHFTLK